MSGVYPRLDTLSNYYNITFSLSTQIGASFPIYRGYQGGVGIGFVITHVIRFKDEIEVGIGFLPIIGVNFSYLIKLRKNFPEILNELKLSTCALLKSCHSFPKCSEYPSALSKIKTL